MPQYLYFSLLLCLRHGCVNVHLFIICFLLFCVVSLFCQCSMPLYWHFCFFSRLWLGFANVLCPFISICVCVLVLPMFYASLFLFFLFSCFCGSALPMFYVSLFIVCFLLFCTCCSVLPMFYAFCLYLCLCPGFANVLCLFIYIFSFLLCLCLSFANALCLFIYIFLVFSCLWLVFANVLCLLICIVFFSFVSDVLVFPML